MPGDLDVFDHLKDSTSKAQLGSSQGRSLLIGKGVKKKILSGCPIAILDQGGSPLNKTDP